MRRQGLLELNLVPEEWGGNTVMVPISAKKGTGVEDLLSALVLLAEEKECVANPAKPAAGTVIEAHLDRKRGAVATLLVQVKGGARRGVGQAVPRSSRWSGLGVRAAGLAGAAFRAAGLAAPSPRAVRWRAITLCARPHAPGPLLSSHPQAGTLRVGDIVVAGASMGKVRSMTNAAAASISEAGPSIAVQMVGLNNVPMAGEAAGRGSVGRAGCMRPSSRQQHAGEQRPARLGCHPAWAVYGRGPACRHPWHPSDPLSASPLPPPLR